MFATLRCRRRLRRLTTAFEATLPSRVPGISFTAVLTAVHLPRVDAVDQVEPLALALRSTLRRAAAEIAAQQDPADVPVAEDACRASLLGQLAVADNSRATVSGHVTLGLDGAAESAVIALRLAQQEQYRRDIVTDQRLHAFARLCGDPALVLARILESNGHMTADSAAGTAAEETALAFRQLVQGSDESLEGALLSQLRSFFASFPREEQKRFLVVMVASMFRAAKEPDRAAAVEALTASMAGDPDATR